MSASHHHDHGGLGSHAAHHEMHFAFVVSTLLNIGIVVLQIVYGVMAHSSALLADAGHNLGDVLSLIIAGGAALLSPPRAHAIPMACALHPSSRRCSTPFS